MNKFTKQLLSLGLSVVTVAGMITPVLADDVSKNQVNETQEDAVNEKTYHLTIKYLYEDKEDEKKDFKYNADANSENVMDYIANTFVPEGYRIGGGASTSGIYQDSGKDSWVLEMYKAKSVDLKVCRNDQWEEPYTLIVPYGYTDEQIEEKIKNSYVYDSDTLVSLVKDDTGVWNLYVNTKTITDDTMQTYQLIISKDGVESTEIVSISLKDINEAGGIYQYLKMHYVPDGYYIDYSQSGYLYSGIFPVDSTDNTKWKIFLLKNNENPTLKKYTVKILKSKDPSFNPNVSDEFNGNEIEYQTFEYDSQVSDKEICDYIQRKFTPSGYTIYYGPVIFNIQKIDDSTFMAIAYKNLDQSEMTNPTQYTLEYYDTESKTTLSMYGNTYVYGGEKNTLSVSDIDEVPDGYVLDGDSFKVEKRDERNYGIVYVKKGMLDTPVSIHFYKNNNGKIVGFKTIEKKASELDLNNDGQISDDEVLPYVPNGYKYSNVSAFGYGNYKSYGTTKTKCNMAYLLETVSTVETPSDSKESVSIKDDAANEILSSSLNDEQKDKYKEASKEGKEIVFKPVVKDAVKADEEVLTKKANELSAKVVNAFDISIEMLIDGQPAGTISETNSKLRFNVNIPNELKKAGRKFYVLRLHDGSVDKLPVDENGNFETDKFSSYMLVYEDEVETPAKPDTDKKDDGNTGGSGNISNSGNTGSVIGTINQSSSAKKDTSKNNSKKNSKNAKGVNTSVRTTSTLFVSLMGISVASIGALKILKRKNK